MKLRAGIRVKFEFAGKTYEGTVTQDTEGHFVVNNTWIQFVNGETCDGITNLRPASDDIENVTEGAVIVDDDGIKRIVLGISGKAIHCSMGCDYEQTGWFFTITELKSLGYHLDLPEENKLKEAEQYLADKGLKIEGRIVER